MFKQLLSGTAIGLLIASSALAETTQTQQTTSAAPAAGTFLQQQTTNEWRSSKFVGTRVLGPDNQSIGNVSDVLFDPNGNIKAVVVGVGGFLGIGEKDVAIPFKDMKVTMNPDGSMDHISVTYTRDQLNSAPSFKYLGSKS